MTPRTFFAGLASLALGTMMLTAGGCATRAIPAVQMSGDQALAAGDYEMAILEYREVLSRRPGRWQTRTALGEALLEGGYPAEAREQLEVAAAARTPPTARVTDLLTRAMLESGDVESVVVRLRSIATDSRRPADWINLGRTLAETGDPDGAETALLTAARLDRGRHVGPQLALAQLYESAGDADKAFERYRMVLFLDADNQAARDAIAARGEIPGPTLSIVPTERAAFDLN